MVSAGTDHSKWPDALSTDSGGTISFCCAAEVEWGNLLAMKSLATSRCWASLPCIRRREMGAAAPLGVHSIVNFPPALRTSLLAGAMSTLKPGI